MKKRGMEIKRELYGKDKPCYIQYSDPETGKLCKFDIKEIAESKWIDRYNSWVSETRPVVKFVKKIETHAFTKMCRLENNIVFFIDKFTQKKYDEEDLLSFRLKMLNTFRGVVKNIKFVEGGRLWIELQDKTIKARKLTEVLDNIEEIIPDIQTDERRGKCHRYSCLLMMALEVECHVVTGICYTLSPRGKFLHSWVEATNEKGETYCFDATMNLMMPKEDFYCMWHVKPCATLTKSQFEEDVPKFEAIGGLDVKQYLLNREETLKAVEKMSTKNLGNQNE